MKNMRIPSPVKYALIIIAVIFVVFVYSFWGSKLEEQNKDIRTPEAYGVDSLEYQAEPVMEIRVWQRNDKNPDDYPEHDFFSSFFYTIIPLPLEVGASVDTVCAPYYREEHAILDISYDGDISGYYEIPAPYMVAYTGESDIVPIYKYSANILMNDDATFRGNQKVTLGLYPKVMDLKVMLEGKMVSLVTSAEQTYGFRFKDYYQYEYFHEVYPDALQLERYQNLKKLKRIVMTNYLTIQAMHPTKPDIPVATAVLEITKYSSWFGATLSPEERRFVHTKGRQEDYAPGKITVVSYEQSDFFSRG